MIDKNILSSKLVSSLRSAVYINKTKEIIIKGLSGSSRSFAMAATIDNGIHIVLEDSRDKAAGTVNDLYRLLGDEKVFFFPPNSNKMTRSSFKDSSMKVQRTSAIGALNNFIKKQKSVKNNVRDFIVLVAYPDSFSEGIINEKELKNSILKIEKGMEITHSFLKELLFDSKFEKVDFVSQPGEFAIRGSIIDIFSFGDSRPYRIDFFGDEIESIKIFDVNSQHSIKELEEVEIFPDISSDANTEIEEVDFFDFVPATSILWVGNEVSFNKISGDFRKIYLDPIAINKSINTIEFHTKPQPSFNKQFDMLSDDIKIKKEAGFEVSILTENRKQIDRMKEIFSNYGVKLNFENISIQEGFIDLDERRCYYTDHQIFERYKRNKIKRTVDRSEKLSINDINSFNEGDYIVHIDHGIGRFGGLVKNNINGHVQEAVKLIYKGGDVIFVSIHGLHRISKYKSADSKPPKIYKLGTPAWNNLKMKAKSKVKDIAADLIKLYAKRTMAEGFAFSPDSYMQRELESSFMYEDTPDQSKVTKEIKEDMEKPYPMDRLVCGDVGFGKTEMAVRAAFKAVADSKQVAVLVPTTILAIQHYNTFKKRMAKLPCNIDVISRLRTAKEIKDITERLKEGKIDIIIGTHKLLNKNLQYKDLGLLIIDEEQKFGVAAKEKLRHLKLSVDTLTLSATPIPRTLQFSLFGARDLSLITTPPPNRLPVQTEIIDFNKEIIHDIIMYEVERGGQVFFVHNRVEDILSVEGILHNVCPEIKICVAHGQMDSKILEKKLFDFINGDYDLLLSTTIIENGIDISNANTMIINQAQNFGLSDLHQLRGRVGRSNSKAFCYLIVPPMSVLSDDARRRLKAIEAFSDLGSGFNIAMQDLDIRGMGNLLGSQQSGYIADIGFETYQRILQEAFEELKGDDYKAKENNQIDEDKVYVNDCIIDTDMQLLIPDSYINITSEKIRLYKELDNITEESVLDKFMVDLEDRFGPIPEELNQLCFVVRLRKIAMEKGFEKIVLKNQKMAMFFISNEMSDYYKTAKFSNILKYIQSKPGYRYQIKENNNKLYVTVDRVRTIEGAYQVIKKM